MSSSEPTNGGSAPPAPSDRELLESLRAGDDEAYGRLWRRHQPAALRAARQYDRGPEAEDIAAEAFARVLDTVRQGDGPLEAFRAYLLRSVAQVAQNARAQRSLSEGGLGYGDATLEALDEHFIARAYDQLTPEQREILWYIDVERLPLGDAATMLGVAPGTAATLAAEARDALGREYLQVHLEQRADQPGCAATLERVPTYLRGGVTTLQRMRIDRHIGGCGSCSLAVAELNEIGAGLREVLGPLVLGTAAASFGYFAESAEELAGRNRTEPGDASAAEAAASTGAVATHRSTVEAASAMDGAAGRGSEHAGGLAVATAGGAAYAGADLDPADLDPADLNRADSDRAGFDGSAYDSADHEPGHLDAAAGLAGASSAADAHAHQRSAGSADARGPFEAWADDDSEADDSAPSDLRRFATPKAAAVAGVAVLALSGLALAGVLMGGEDDTTDPGARVQAAESRSPGKNQSPGDQASSRPEPTSTQGQEQEQGQEEPGTGRERPARLGTDWPPSTPGPGNDQPGTSPSPNQTLEPPRSDGDDGGNGGGVGGAEPLRVSGEVLSGDQWRTENGVSYVAIQADRLEPGAAVRMEIDAPTFTHLTEPVGTLPKRPPLPDDDAWTCQASGTVSVSGYDCYGQADSRGRITVVLTTRSTLGVLNRAAYDVTYLFRSGFEVETGSVRVR